MTTGHLGIEIAQVEKQLGEIFMLGYRWGAVVLLDEADVLMSQRTLGDLHRNAIVAGTCPARTKLILQHSKADLRSLP